MPITITVNGHPAPVITPNGPTTFCGGGSVNLTASRAHAYQWYRNGVALVGNLGQGYMATAGGDYTVEATYDNGHKSTSAATTVTVHPSPAPYAVTGGGTYCGSEGVAVGLSGSETGFGYRLLLNGSAAGDAVPGTGATAVTGNTNSWTSNPAGFTSNLANPTVSPATTTTYTVTETITATGCQAANQVTVTVQKPFYGLTRCGGANGKEAVVLFDAASNTISAVHSFGNDGSAPYGGLIKARDGGLFNQGVLFSFYPSTSVFTKLYDVFLPFIPGAIK